MQYTEMLSRHDDETNNITSYLDPADVKSPQRSELAWGGVTGDPRDPRSRRGAGLTGNNMESICKVYAMKS